MSTDVKVSPTQQAVILLALITSSLITLKENELIEDENLKTVLDLGVLQMHEIIRKYPSESKEDFSQTTKLMKGVSELINKSNSWFTAPVIAYLGHKICADLLGEVCNKEKRQLILTANEIVGVFNDFIDPDGDDEETHVEVAEMLDSVYKFLGFTTELRYFEFERKLRRRRNKHGPRV